MTEAIIVALITAASAVACQLVIAANSRKTMQQAQYDSQKLIEYKIDKLSERVDKHNSVIARTYKLEQDYALPRYLLLPLIQHRQVHGYGE